MARAMTGLALVLALTAWSCGGSDPDCATPAFTSFVVDPDTVAAGADVTVTIAGDHLNFEGDPDHVEGCPGGHLHLYMDDLMTNPLIMEETKSFAVTIPSATSTGSHTLIIRLHNHDHTIVEPQVTEEAALTVQ